MNAERLQDTMNFLDDDLIEETNALRMGERVLHRKPKVLRWVVPAACLALAVGAVSLLPVAMESAKSDSAIFENMADAAPGAMNGMPESVDQDAAEISWHRVNHGAISLKLPADWDYELTGGTDEAQYICFGPAGEPALRVGFDPYFGVCGTGLREEETSIAGMIVRAGYYDGADMWSFAVFTELEPTYVIINDAGEEWWAAYGGLALAVLDTIEIEG